MGKAIFFLIAIFFVYQIFKNRGVNKLIWFFGGILFFPPTIILLENPLVSFPRLMIYSLLLATILQYKNLYAEYKKFPLKYVLAFIFVMLLIIGYQDARLGLFHKIYRPTVYFIERFLVMFLTYLYIKDIKDLKKLYHILFIFFLFFGLYGLSNYITKSSIYAEIINYVFGGVDTVGTNMTSESHRRFRISSFSWHAIFYGLILNVIILLLVFVFNNIKDLNILKKKRYIYIFVMALVIANLLLVNSRTPILALVAGLGIFFIFGFSFKKKIQYIVSGFLLLFCLYVITPDSFTIVDKTVETFSDKGTDVGGSTMEMRLIQLAASIVVFNDAPIYGHGFSYIQEDMGFSRDKELRTSDKEFAGFESYAFVLLIEQGLIGIIANLVFFIFLFYWHIKNYKQVDRVGKNLILLNISITITFLFFILGTGDLGTFLFVNCILGVNIKAITTRKVEGENVFISMNNLTVSLSK